MTYYLHHGDCVDVMRTLPAESVDAIVTSPPYAEQRKSTYGGIPEKEYPDWTVAWMSEAKRLLKPDGSAIINIRPHIKGGILADYVLRTRIALREQGWAECEELVWHKPDAMPMAPVARPRRSWESLLWYAKHGRPFSDPKAAGSPARHKTNVWGTGQHMKDESFRHFLDGGRTSSTPKIARVTNVLSMTTDKVPTGHPAPFPVGVAEWCGKLICPPGGTVLDPFNGSASTGVAAIRNGWDYIGIDAVQEYIEMSEQRLLHVTQEMERGAA